MKLLSASILAAALLAGCGGMSRTASMPDGPTRTADGVLIGPTGMTLYTFDRDAAGSGKSTCNGPCATNWPPLMAADAAKPMGAYTIVVRDDGKRQSACGDGRSTTGPRTRRPATRRATASTTSGRLRGPDLPRGCCAQQFPFLACPGGQW